LGKSFFLYSKSQLLNLPLILYNEISGERMLMVELIVIARPDPIPVIIN
jgi:hypothetical protein